MASECRPSFAELWQEHLRPRGPSGIGVHREHVRVTEPGGSRYAIEVRYETPCKGRSHRGDLHARSPGCVRARREERGVGTGATGQEGIVRLVPELDGGEVV